ncbi:hypothetical protein JCM19241_4416 [Vibrio ishigakensis]|uniref:Uncharacterized protein n=1 Tax=Vibrio ishigakensis TaxID=1481914 RepID=A0A0B8QKV1_9VIBR|nr:hypothetical protein JCM19241_4416 [Vibrio ishigakensis]
MNGIIGHLVITGGFFCLTTKFYKEPVGERKAELEHFWTDVDTLWLKQQVKMRWTVSNAACLAS